MKHCKNNYTREKNVCNILQTREKESVWCDNFIKKIYGEDDGYDKI